MSTLYAQIESTITSIDDTLASIEPIELTKFKSGIIVRDLGENQIILDTAIYIGDNSIKIEKYNKLHQDSFPALTSKVQVGDKVIFDLYSRRVMIIAKNAKEYSEFEKQLKEKEIMHPDMLAAVLNKAGTQVPKQEQFQSICHEYSLGSYYFLLENKSYEVDCNSFKVVSESDFSVTNDETSMTPFYHRFDPIKKGLFNYEKDITDYTKYYKELIGIQ